MSAHARLLDHRTYTLYPGAVTDYFARYEARGLAVQRRHLVNMVGYFATESGPLNQVIHIWAYRDAGDREQRRAALGADPEWQAYVKDIRTLIVTQETKLLTPAPFCRIALA